MPASAQTSYTTPKRDKPAWYTDAFHQQVLAAGADGIQLTHELIGEVCPGVQDEGVGAGGCIVAPAGCTANFVFTTGTSFDPRGAGNYVGTASHCVDDVGQPVTMAVNTTTVAVVGTVAKQTAKEEPGEDFALISIDPAIASRYGVTPAMPIVGGPQGVYTGCGVPPESVRYYGHGYGVVVAQGKPEGGLALHWYDDAYGWEGVGAPGDSGSGAVTTTGQAAGNFTHIIISDPSLHFVPSELTGMRATKILQFAGANLVNADGSVYTGPTTSNCGESVTGGSSGGGGGNGGGGKSKPRG